VKICALAIRLFEFLITLHSVMGEKEALDTISKSDEVWSKAACLSADDKLDDFFKGERCN
jgi:hypothetical protein